MVFAASKAWAFGAAAGKNILPVVASTASILNLESYKDYRQIVRKSLHVRGRYSWRSRANRGLCCLLALACLMGALCKAGEFEALAGNPLNATQQSIHETGQSAAYSTLRSKKTHIHSSEGRSVKPRRHSASVRCGAKFSRWAGYQHTQRLNTTLLLGKPTAKTRPTLRLREGGSS
jgi:hypothetical protein